LLLGHILDVSVDEVLGNGSKSHNQVLAGRLGRAAEAGFSHESDLDIRVALEVE
jgi:hypothetical protein